MNEEEFESKPLPAAQSTNVSGAYFAPGSSAEHEQGVLYQGDYQHDSDGTAVAIRLHARALRSAGVPVLLKPFSNSVLTNNGTFEPLHVAGISDHVRKEVGDMPTMSIGKLYPSIKHFVVHKQEEIPKRIMRGSLGPLDDPEIYMRAVETVYGSTVLYSVWERDWIPLGISKELKRIRDNWVPCEQNVSMLDACGVPNAYAMPHPYDPESPLIHLTRRRHMQSKRFYWIGRWEPRKNPVMILEAFCSAFTPDDDVHLTMKFHGAWKDYPTFEETVQSIVKRGAWTEAQISEKVTPIRGFLREDKIVKLHFENNIYLAPSCGEAWCLPAFEAKVAGNQVIHTPYGGTADFCDERDLELSYDLAPTHPSYGWEGAKWAQVDLTEFSNLLEAAQPQTFVRSKDFEDRFSLAAVGLRMRDRLKSVFGSKIRW